MNKTNLLLNVVSDLHRLADSIQAVVDSSEQSEPQTAETPVPKADKPKEVKPDIGIEKVRAVLAEKSQSGKTAEVRALLQKFGAAKLSEIESDKYSELLKAAEEL
jgi:hypothetical protein